ncbi:unnamed protein product [Caretta caretta]
MVIVIMASQQHLSQCSATEQKLKDWQAATTNGLQTLRQTILQGWLDKRPELPEDVHAYWSYKEELSVEGGLVFRNDRIIPENLREKFVALIPEKHHTAPRSYPESEEGDVFSRNRKDLMSTKGIVWEENENMEKKPQAVSRSSSEI